MPGIHFRSSETIEGSNTSNIRRADEQFRRLEHELRGQTRVLERIAHGDSLDDLLAMLIDFAEEARPEMTGSILLLDERTGYLQHAVSNNLPDFCCEVIAGVKPGLEVGCCGMAAFTGKRVIVEDIRAHPFWTNYRDLAEQASLRACWSEPILSSSNDVLGTFAMYYQEPRTPDESDLEFIASCANLAALAIERVRADTRLRRMAAIVESTDDAIILKNLDGTIGSWNRGAELIYGYTAAEAIGQPIAMLVPEDLFDELKSIVDRIQRGEQIDHFETIRVTKAGRKIDVSLTVSPIKDVDGSTIGFATIARDITERKRSEETIAESRRRLSTLMSNLPGAAYRCQNDEHWTTEFISDGCMGLCGY